MLDGATNVAPRFKGQSIELGGTTFVVPPLALGALRELLPRIQQIQTISAMPSAEDIDTIVDVLHAALKRNYPELARETVLDLVDLGNLWPIFAKVMGQSGLRETPAGNAPPGAASS